MRHLDENRKADGFEERISPIENLLGKKMNIVDW
jgi:hypothetical protein